MELESTRIFVKVVQLGSFTKAADLLKLPKSTVSRTVTRLEAESGTKLIQRTTRSMTLTTAGQVFYDNCVDHIQALEEARKTLHGKDSLIIGHVRLTAPEDLGVGIISSAIGALTKKQPGLYFELNFTDEVIDLVKEGYDMAIRVGKLSVTRYKARRIGEIKMILVTSPQYLKQTGPIKKPQDLMEHNCLSFSGSLSPHWHLVSKSSRVTVKSQHRIVANQMSSLLNLTIQGVGIAMLPQYLCREALEAGKIVRILPDWDGLSYPVSIVTPPGYSNSSRLKLVSDQLAKAIQESLKP